MTFRSAHKRAPTFREDRDRLSATLASLGPEGRRMFFDSVKLLIEEIRNEDPDSFSRVSNGHASLDVVLGQGGLSNVFLCRSTHPEIRSAAKVPRHELLTVRPEGARRCYRNSIAFLAKSVPLDSLHLPLFMAGSADPPFILTEVVPGSAPDYYINNRRFDRNPLEASEVLDILSQMATALSQVHKIITRLSDNDPNEKRGTVHGDVKPENYLIAEHPDPRYVEDSEKRVTLIDFDFVASDGLTERRSDGYVTGTPEYMAPELFRDAPFTHLSDLYGLGISYHELLAGTIPFSTLRFLRSKTRNIRKIFDSFKAAHLEGRLDTLPKDFKSAFKMSGFE